MDSFSLFVPVLAVLITLAVLHRLKLYDTVLFRRYCRIANAYDCNIDDRRSPLEIAVLLVLLGSQCQIGEWIMAFRNRHRNANLVALAFGSDKSTIEVLQFVVEWLLLRHQPVRAFFLFFRNGQDNSRATSVFTRLQLERFLAMQPSQGEYCEKLRRHGKYTPQYYHTLIEEERRLSELEQGVRQVLEAELRMSQELITAIGDKVPYGLVSLSEKKEQVCRLLQYAWEFCRTKAQLMSMFLLPEVASPKEVSIIQRMRAVPSVATLASMVCVASGE